MTDTRLPAPAAVADPAQRPAGLPYSLQSTPSSGNAALWYAFFAPPVAWSIDQLAAISVHQDFCAAVLSRQWAPWAGVDAVLVMVGLVMLAVALSGGWVAWRAYAVLGDDNGYGDTGQDRRSFMARASILSCGLFSFGIVLRLLTLAFIRSANCG